MPRLKQLKRRKLTVELIDELLRIHDVDLDDPDWERYMEMLWGMEGEEGIMLDLLVLARVALEHINVVIVQGGPKDAKATDPPAT